MDWIITTTLFLSVLKAALCFNIDPVAWKTLTQSAAGFGYQVVQRRSDFLVSAPRAQSSHGGQIYKCSTESCRVLPVNVPQVEYAVNMSLGLTMASDPSTQNTLACGPTIPKDCRSITMYSGLCFQIDRSDRFTGPIPSSGRECQSADIAFLLDGSGSVKEQEFLTMKTFVKDLVRSLKPLGTKFAIAQFSTNPRVHFYFDDFFSGTKWEAKVDGIKRLTGWTYTAKAIEYVVGNIFIPTRGSRSNVKKVLIVITDGESNDQNNLQSAINLAEQAKIIRFAIGVGNAFTNDQAKRELETIASSPTENVFRVESFDALEKIRKGLQAKLFSIEGSQSGDSLKLEMAQEGFSAAYVPGGIQMAIVGANEWKGGYLQYSMPTRRKTSSFEPTDNIDADSYLGYSMAVAITMRGTLTIVGAPRYKHRGAVMVVSRNRLNQMIDPSPYQFQSGEYFGAVVCAMDVDHDIYIDLILISAPMFVDNDREGRVYVCSLTVLNVECRLDSPLVLRGAASDNGRFGSSLAVLPDLNTDGLNELAVGAPLEDNGRGSIYIFHGEGQGRISSAYSQRIAGSEVGSGLKFFGMSISQSSFDHSSDDLPDLAVGSKGAVVLLRSKPIVMVEATVSFSPNQISSQNSDCSPLKNTVEICFTMTRHSAVNQARARISYNLTLDATRKVPSNRAYITAKQREMNGTVTLDLTGRVCKNVPFSVDACPEDALNELKNELRFTFEGLPIGQNPSPSLALQAQTAGFHPLGFEINCGTDDKCVDNLKVDFNFTSSLEVKVGIDELLDVTVSVENSEENSYNSHVILTYPVGLSYRKFTVLQQGRIECNSLDSEDGVTRGKTDCTVNKPILKSNTKAFFIISYGIETRSQLDRKIFVSANATSGNEEHASSSELYKVKEIDVKYSIFATIESSLSYSNFSFGKNNLHKPVQQSIVVTNDIRALNFTVVIRVPVRLGDKDIWVDSSSLQIPGCQRDKEEEPNVTDFIAKIQKNKLVDCSVARCTVFKCSMFMGRLESKKYNISANLSSGWIEQIGLKSAKFVLTSTASLEYDRKQYIFFSTGSYNNPPVRKIEAEVEVYPELDFTKEIVGGSLGGLAFLALLTAGLYKAGFFKSKYKEMINADAADPGVDGGAPTPE